MLVERPVTKLATPDDGDTATGWEVISAVEEVVVEIDERVEEVTSVGEMMEETAVEVVGCQGIVRQFAKVVMVNDIHATSLMVVIEPYFKGVKRHTSNPLTKAPNNPPPISVVVVVVPALAANNASPRRPSIPALLSSCRR